VSFVDAVSQELRTPRSVVEPGFTAPSKLVEFAVVAPPEVVMFAVLVTSVGPDPVTVAPDPFTARPDPVTPGPDPVEFTGVVSVEEDALKFWTSLDVVEVAFKISFEPLADPVVGVVELIVSVG
jgi:hypothetical protein